MNQLLTSIINDNTVQFNKDVTEGTATKILRTVPDYLDGVIRSSIRSLSPGVDLVYEGYRRVTPKEEHYNNILSKATSPDYDLAYNDVYYLELKFSYMGERISRYLYLPYADRGNLVTMGGIKYHIQPVLSDTIISPSHDRVFVRLLKAKLTFHNRVRNFIVDGVRVAGTVVYSEILKLPATSTVDNIGRPMTATSLYLLGRLGVAETVSQYTKASNVIITDENVDHLRDTHIVYESTKIKPRGLKEYAYQGHDVKVLVSKDVEDRTLLDTIIFGLIYTLDILPEAAGDLVDIYANGDLVQEKAYWKILLGRVAYKNAFSVDRIVTDVDNHYNVLEGYMDTQIQKKLTELGIYVNDFFDLLAVILSKYNLWLINSKEYNSDANNRYLDYLYYILYDIIIGFNRVILGINKRASKKAVLSRKEIIKISNNELSPKKIFSLTKSTEVNLAISVVDYSGDIMYPKITSILEDQSRGNGVRRGKQSTLPEATKTLKGGDLGFGSLLFLGTNLPSPRFKINPFLRYNIVSGKIHHPKDIVTDLATLAIQLQGRAGENTKILDSELSSDEDTAVIPT